MTDSNVYTNRAMRTFHNKLAEHVEARLGKKCPCCRYPMVKLRGRHGGRTLRRDAKTVAHDTGNNPTRWVYACYGCNNDQGALSFRAWSARLAYNGDRRAPFVAELASVVEAFKGETCHAEFSRPFKLIPTEAAE